MLFSIKKIAIDHAWARFARAQIILSLLLIGTFMKNSFNEVKSNSDEP